MFPPSTSASKAYTVFLSVLLKKKKASLWKVPRSSDIWMYLKTAGLEVVDNENWKKGGNSARRTGKESVKKARKA